MKKIGVLVVSLLFCFCLTAGSSAQTKASFAGGLGSYSQKGKSSEFQAFYASYYFHPAIKIRGEISRFSTSTGQEITSLMVGGIYTVTSFRLLEGEVILRPYIGSGMGRLLLPAESAMQVVAGVEFANKATDENLSLVLELKYLISSMAVESERAYSDGLFCGFFLNIKI